jgi:hypothetical protein
MKCHLCNNNLRTYQIVQFGTDNLVRTEFYCGRQACMESISNVFVCAIKINYSNTLDKTINYSFCYKNLDTYFLINGNSSNDSTTMCSLAKEQSKKLSRRKYYDLDITQDLEPQIRRIFERHNLILTFS